MDWRDIISRAIWTFLQAFMATLAAGGGSFDKRLINASVISGLAAAFSAVKTTALSVKNRPPTPDEPTQPIPMVDLPQEGPPDERTID